MFKTFFPRKASRFTVPILGALVLAGGIAAAPAAAEPPQPLRIQSQSADLLVLAQSHREYRRDGSRYSRSEGNAWREQRHGHDRAQRPHHRRHIVKRDWRRPYRGHHAKRYDWRRPQHGHHAKRYDWRRPQHGYRAKRYGWRGHDNRSRRDWGHQARRYLYR